MLDIELAMFAVGDVHEKHDSVIAAPFKFNREKRTVSARNVCFQCGLK